MNGITFGSASEESVGFGPSPEEDDALLYDPNSIPSKIGSFVGKLSLFVIVRHPLSVVYSNMIFHSKGVTTCFSDIKKTGWKSFFIGVIPSTLISLCAPVTFEFFRNATTKLFPTKQTGKKKFLEWEKTFVEENGFVDVMENINNLKQLVGYPANAKQALSFYFFSRFVPLILTETLLFPARYFTSNLIYNNEAIGFFSAKTLIWEHLKDKGIRGFYVGFGFQLLCSILSDLNLIFQSFFRPVVIHYHKNCKEINATFFLTSGLLALGFSASLFTTTFATCATAVGSVRQRVGMSASEGTLLPGFWLCLLGTNPLFGWHHVNFNVL